HSSCNRQKRCELSAACAGFDGLSAEISMTTAEHLIEPTAGRGRPIPWPTRETLDNLARSPTLHIPRPGKPPVQLPTDRVPARPALTPTLSGALGMGAVGLGLWGLFAPRSVSRSLGLKADPTTVRAVFGLRELA